jgi:undecaprenyl-diphosphatase
MALVPVLTLIAVSLTQTAATSAGPEAAGVTGSPYEVDPVVDVAVAAGGLATSALIGIVKPSLAGGSSCAAHTPSGRCDPSGLNALDRTVVGNDSAGWRRTSDVGLYLALALPVAATALDVALGAGDARLAPFATDVLVMAEALAVSQVITDVTKLAVRRARPTQYRDAGRVESVEQQMSFPSGHTSATAAAVTAYTVTFSLRHPDSPWRFAVAGAAVVLTSVTAWGRVAGGMHFYTDVIGGAVIGAAAGLAVPLAHRRVRLTPVVGPGSRGLALAGDF